MTDFMKRILLTMVLVFGIGKAGAQKIPEKKDVATCMEKVNGTFMERHRPAGDSVRTTVVRPSNVWTRSVYFEGLMALHSLFPLSEYTEYALTWAETNRWNFCGGPNTLDTDNQCCAQTYIDLYRMYGNPQALDNVERMVNNVVNNTTRNDWNEVSALQTAMPVYARMCALKKDMRYAERMMELYRHLRNRVGLYNPVDGLWWQSAEYMPPYKEPNGKNCYWSRGNGWALAGLARTLEEIDNALPGFADDNLRRLQDIRKSLAKDFTATAMAVKDRQREDGFWNCSLDDSLHYGGPETSATSLFIYGMAWGIRKQLLSPDIFLPTVVKGWKGLTGKAVHPEGTLGHVQGEGREPKDSQPTGYAFRTDGEDFAVGCFLLAGTELFKLLPR